jgi:hypothetical protein
MIDGGACGWTDAAVMRMGRSMGDCYDFGVNMSLWTRQITWKTMLEYNLDLSTNIMF